jgi:hypothetical protein
MCTIKIALMLLLTAAVVLGCDVPPEDETAAGNNESMAVAEGEPDLGGEPLPSYLSRDLPMPAGRATTGSLDVVTGALSEEYRVGPWGGPGGAPFSIRPVSYGVFQPTWRLAHLYIKSGKYVDSIEAWYLDPNGNFHYGGKAGGNGGYGRNMFINQGQPLTQAGGYSGSYIDRLSLSTVTQGTWFGGDGGNPFGPAEFEPLGKTIQGFFGRAGSYIDAIGFYGYSP